MAQKRMFNMKIVDSDVFLDMPLSAQCLYFHLNMRADDDGFIGNPRKIQRIIGSNEDDLKLLILKRFILTFNDGVIVIKHWRIHNCISQNRYCETVYKDEKSQLLLKQNSAYSFSNGTPINDLKAIEQSKRQADKTRRSIDVQKTDAGLDLDIDKDLNKDINNNCSSENDEPVSKKSQVELNFDKLWNLYPLKRGRGKVSDANKRRLLDIGFDELNRAINRYKADLAKENWRKPQNGSTFFNSGYIDYLDNNYVAPPKDQVPAEPKNRFHNFNQRETDYDALIMTDLFREAKRKSEEEGDE